MKIKSLLSVIFLSGLLSLGLTAQDLISFPAPSMKFQMLGDGGRNGTAVVYNPEMNLYYGAMAGNADFPLETFSYKGENLFQSRTFNDMRGMWWNPREGTLEGNCYADGGIVSIGIDENGYAGTGNMVVFSGSHQPWEHSCGTLDPKKKEILYYHQGYIYGYSRKDGTKTDTYLMLDLPADDGSINYSTLIFTAHKKMELGVLDVDAGKVYLFNRKDGSHTGTISLPSDAQLYEGFNFAYANDHIFLFDQDTRSWTGYRVFK